MKYLLAVILLSGCSTMKFQRVVDPLEAVQLCGKAGVKEYSALAGNITCRKEVKNDN